MPCSVSPAEPSSRANPTSQRLRTPTLSASICLAPPLRALRTSPHNTKSALARLLRPHYARGDDEARALLREAFTLSGDLQITGDTIHVRLDPPRRRSTATRPCRAGSNSPPPPPAAQAPT